MWALLKLESVALLREFMSFMDMQESIPFTRSPLHDSKSFSLDDVDSLDDTDMKYGNDQNSDSDSSAPIRTESWTSTS